MGLNHLLKYLKSYWIAFIIPGILLLFSLVLKASAGPYWQFPDPSYGYLLSSISIFKSFSTTFRDHPGTPLEILGAGIIFLFNLGHSTADSIHNVLLRPEFYLNAINLALIFLLFISSLICGSYVYRLSNDKYAVLLFQVPLLSFLSLRSYSFYDYVLPVVTNVSPEPLLISISCLFNLCFIRLFFAHKDREKISLALLLGFICGLGAATRLTFLLFLILPLFVFHWRARFLFIAASVLSFVLWTIPIISSYSWIGSWVFKLTTHVGGYGSGAVGFVDWHQYLLNWHSILNRCGFLIAAAFIALIVSSWQAIRARSIQGTGFIWSTAFCILLQLSLIAKHYDDHYLVSAINLFGSFFVLFYLRLANKRSLLKAGIALCMILFVAQSLKSALAYNKQLSQHTREALQFNGMIHAKYADFMIIGINGVPMPVPEIAFFWGNDRDRGEQDELMKLHSGYLAYFSNSLNVDSIYDTGLYSFEKRLWAADLIAAGSKVIVVVPKGYDIAQTPYNLLPLEQGKFTNVYFLAGSTDKQANDLFEAAMQLSQNGDYARAFAVALKSRELRYRPVEKVDLLLSLLYQQMKH